MRLMIAGLIAALAAGAASAQDKTPDTADALKTLIQDILAATQAGETAKVETMVKALVLPKADEWFRNVFGDEVGARVAAEYAKMSEELVPQVTKIFRDRVEKKQTTVEVKRITSADDKEGTGLQRAAIGAMKKPVALYHVSFGGFSLWSFVHTDEGFRLAGKMRALRADGRPESR